MSNLPTICVTAIGGRFSAWVLGAAAISCASSPAEGVLAADKTVEAVEQAISRAGPPESLEGALARGALLDRTARREITRLDRRAESERYEELAKKIRSIDQSNTELIRPLVRSRKWLSSAFPQPARDNVWLLAQHSPEVRLQEEVLASAEKATRDGLLEVEKYALLFDRVAVRRNRPQRYGTQLRCVQGEYRPYPMEAPDALQIRRKEAGLMPMDEYLTAVGRSC